MQYYVMYETWMKWDTAEKLKVHVANEILCEVNLLLCTCLTSISVFWHSQLKISGVTDSAVSLICLFIWYISSVFTFSTTLFTQFHRLKSRKVKSRNWSGQLCCIFLKIYSWLVVTVLFKQSGLWSIKGWDDSLQWFGKKWPWLMENYYSSICLRGLKKTAENFSKYSQSLQWNLNLRCCEFKQEWWPLIYSICWLVS